MSRLALFHAQCSLPPPPLAEETALFAQALLHAALDEFQARMRQIREAAITDLDAAVAQLRAVVEEERGNV